MNMNKLQLMSINILNSKYRVLFTLGIYFIVYSLFYSDSVAFCMRSGNIPAIAESKDEIIRNLQKQVNDLTADREFLYKTVQDVMKDSFEAKQQHLNELRKAQEEVFDLRFRNLRVFQTAQSKSLPVIAHAEPVIEASTQDVVAISLQEENIRLRADLKKAVEDASLNETQLKGRLELQKNHITAQNKTIQELQNQKQSLEEKLILAEKKIKTSTNIDDFNDCYKSGISRDIGLFPYYDYDKSSDSESEYYLDRDR